MKMETPSREGHRTCVHSCSHFQRPQNKPQTSHHLSPIPYLLTPAPHRMQAGSAPGPSHCDRQRPLPCPTATAPAPVWPGQQHRWGRGEGREDAGA